MQFVHMYTIYHIQRDVDNFGESANSASHKININNAERNAAKNNLFCLSNVIHMKSLNFLQIST